MKLSEHQIIFTYHIAKLIEYAYGLGISMTFGEAYRPMQMQLLYYYGYTIKRIQDTIKLVIGSTKSKTLKSNHQRRLAVDFNFFINGNLTYDKTKLQDLGDYWESLDPLNKWGGNYKSFLDTPHFERRA